ncbi:MAG: metalloregulator ArsR/SmtB family transcription factor [Anaerolineae bacterium]|nr:metalloregulator ArsR/SmtB family transcription factor [Anaerolineae bacterium]
MPEGVQIASLSRSDLLVRISALADDTRLRILRLLGDAQELRAQEIMDRLDLSQSAASRHLRQLSATGFVRERREDGAKCYSLNRERVEDTCQALKQFLA